MRLRPPTKNIIDGRLPVQREPPTEERQRDLHPAAVEAVTRYSQVWDENDRLVQENQRLRNDNEMLQRLDKEKTALINDLRQQIIDLQHRAEERLTRSETYHRERLAEADKSKERYLRYAVSINERLRACIDQIHAAHNLALEMAQKKPQQLEEEINVTVEQLKKPG